MGIQRQLEELVLLKCSLLPDKLLSFVLPRLEDNKAWTQIVGTHSDGDPISSSELSCPAHFTLKTQEIPLWFECQYSEDVFVGSSTLNVTVRGYNISWTEQQRWQDIIQEKRMQLTEADFPGYELVSFHLLPLLHEEYDTQQSHHPETNLHKASPTLEPIFHALLTSHHLKSPQKRHSLQQWSSELCVSGFAKVGYPGIIYCYGNRSSIEEFVRKVKDMQWLALRVRFLEDLPGAVKSVDQRVWIELEKVGEVVDEMRKLGREKYILDLGIGSGGAK